MKGKYYQKQELPVPDQVRIGNWTGLVVEAVNFSKPAWNSSLILNDQNTLTALSCLLELQNAKNIDTNLAIKVGETLSVE